MRKPKSNDARTSAQRSRGLRARSLALLARREYSRAELAQKLQDGGADHREIDALLDALEREKLLSDERYAEARVNALSNRFGARRIAYELRSKGVDPGLVEKALERVHAEELERVRAIATKRFGAWAEDRAVRAKQQRFLISRGFSREAVSRVILGADEDS